MKLAKNFVAATALMFAFSFSSFAGDQQTPGGPTPPPPEPPRTATVQAETKEVTVIVEGKSVVVTVEIAENLWYEALLGLLSIY
jgi:hypothetical protein